MQNVWLLVKRATSKGSRDRESFASPHSATWGLGAPFRTLASERRDRPCRSVQDYAVRSCHSSCIRSPNFLQNPVICFVISYGYQISLSELCESRGNNGIGAQWADHREEPFHAFRRPLQSIVLLKKEHLPGRINFFYLLRDDLSSL